MSTREDGQGSERYARVVIGVLAVAIVFALLPFLSGFVGAAVLAIVVGPAYERLSLHLGRRVAAIITAVVAVVVVLVPGAALAMSLLAQAPGALRAVTQSTLLQRLSTLQVAGVDVGAIADSGVNALLTWVSREAVTLVGGLTLATLNIIVALFGLYYLLVTDHTVWRAARRVLPFSDATIDTLATRFRTTTESMIIGVVLTAFAQGAVVGGAFALTGLPSAAFWGFVTACTSILPVLGSSLVWLPGTLVLAADHRYGAAIALGAIGVVVASQIDNVIRPLVYRRVSQIHPMVTLVGAFAGMRIFGFSGLLLGPLGISYLIELLKAYTLERGVPRASRAVSAPLAAD
ncbi:MAG TPA: AI-2E family transporter [Gemmatimonadaceae bacterium]|jgi:predicted PurR-regulated permease PerM